MSLASLESHVTVFQPIKGKGGTTPREQLPLGTMLARIRDGTYKQWITTLRDYRIHFGEKGYKDEKDKSQAFTPCCALTTRDKEIDWPQKLISTTGIVHYDIDGVDDPEAVKGELARDPRVVFAFVSPSGEGVKVGVAATGIIGPDEYKLVWTALLTEFQQTYATWTFKTDTNVKFIHALCYISHDAQMYVNSQAVPYTMPPPAPKAPRKPRQMAQPGTGASDEARAIEALRYIPSDDREVWLAVGMALHSTGEAWARSAWDDWSQTSEKYDARDQDSKWHGFVVEGGRTIATMFDLAKKYGWTPPKKATWKAPRLPVAIPQMWSEAAPDAAPGGSGTPAPAQPRQVDPDTFLTDNYNARALVRDHGWKLRYCAPWKCWLIWKDTHWKRDTSGEIVRLAAQSIKGLARQVPLLDDAQASALLGHIKSSLSTARLKAMIEQAAQVGDGIPVQPEDFDTHPWLLNCTNGTLNLKTGELLEHNREHLLTSCLTIPYDEHALCPLWETFLRRILADNAEVIAFLQRAVGYALSGVIREHVLLIFWGSGRNGKSTLLMTILKLLGPYGLKAVSELLMASAYDRHPTERADLFQKRLVVVSETEQGRRLAESFTKDATGGENIRARRMHENTWEFEPTHKLFMATNHKPVIKGTDLAIWERLKLVEFNVTIPIEERDPGLLEKLQGEFPGILAWAVRGCRAWQDAGLGEPGDVTKATGKYRAEMDVLGAFIDDCCLTGSNYRVKASDLYEAYKRWCDQTGETAMVQRSWGMALTERSLESGKVQGRSWWKGIALREEEADEK